MILSLQSNVMHGYVGNRASLPLYQAYHIDTDHLDTVRLAAHPGHGTSARDVLDGAVMGALFDDYLTLPDLDQPSAIHIGYFGAVDQVAETARFITALKARFANLIILLDPVFGDHGRPYIGADLITAIRQTLLPLADIITPNQFELSLLSGQDITDHNSAKDALMRLFNRHKQMVVATGITLTDNVTDMICHEGKISCYSAPKQPSGVSGSGDAFAALFLAHLITGHQPADALSQTSGITHHMINHSKSPLTLNMASGLQKIAQLRSQY